MLRAKFPSYRDKSAQGQIDLITNTIKFCAVDLDDIGKTISNATNASPIVITTNSAHGFANGDEVLIRGVLGNTAANGVWKIQNATSTTFELVGSTGNGAYSAGTDYALDLNSYVNLGDVPSGSRIAISTALANKTITKGYFSANNPSFETPSGDPFEMLWLFKETGDVNTSPLIAVYAESPNLPFTPDGVNDVQITINDYIFRQ